MNKLTATLKSIVDETIKTLSQNKNPDSIFNSVSRTLQDIPSNRSDRFLFYLYTHYTSATPEEASPRAYMCASAYAIQAQRDLERKSYENALTRINRSVYLLGRSLEAMKFHELNINTRKDIEKALKEFGAVGGATKDSKRDPVREEAARLLSEKKPNGGWVTAH